MTAGHGRRNRPTPVLVAAVLVAAVLVIGCGTGGGGPATAASPAMTGAPAAAWTGAPGGTPTSGGTPAPTGAPGGTPAPTEVPGPPVARLILAAGEPVDGAMGAYTWGEGGSASPDFVPSSGPSLPAGTRLSVAFTPGLVPLAWTVRWLPAADGWTGTPVLVAQGTGLPRATTLLQPGTWSLSVRARFGPDRDATWYWRITSGG